MSKQENKQTVLESIFAFDAAPIMFESIMTEGDVQYGVQDYDEDLVTTPAGDEVVDPSTLMNVNVQAPVQSGPTFNNEVDEMTDDDKRFVVDEFAKYIMDLHKVEITDDDIDVAGAKIQTMTGMRQDIASFIRDEVSNAEKTLAAQNTSEALPDGAVADMTGDGMHPAEENPGDYMDDAENELDAAMGGLREIQPTTHLVPNEADDTGLGDIDLGLNEIGGSEEAVEPSFDEISDEEAPSLGDDIEGNEQPEGEEQPDGETQPEGDEQPEGEYQPEGDEVSAEEDIEIPSEEEDSLGILDDSTEDESNPLTEAVAASNRIFTNDFKARLESAVREYNQNRAYEVAKAKCESIVADANAKVSRAQFESAQYNDVKARCESIVRSFKEASKTENVKAKLEAVINKFHAKKDAEQRMIDNCRAIVESARAEMSVKERCNAIVEGVRGDTKAKCESIVNDYRNSTRDNRVQRIIAKYKAVTK